MLPSHPGFPLRDPSQNPDARLLRFGTAGIRGARGPGPGELNLESVRLVAAATAKVLWEAGGRRVVLGFDGRLGSLDFAAAASEALSKAGLEVLRWGQPMPTPLLSFAVRALEAHGGLMLTASHNPASDHGIKLFCANGAQADPDFEAQVEREMAALLAGVPPLRTATPGPVREVPPSLDERFLDRVEAGRVGAGGPLVVVYTALHGVGGRLVPEALRRAGYLDIHLVAEQQLPDGDFPTVASPDPAQPGTLDRAFALAKAVEADLVLANDPDADRLAVALPDRRGGWRLMDGEAVGALLAEELLSRGEAGPRAIVSTFLAGGLLQKIAAAHGARFVETGVGFRWIGAQLAQLEAAGTRAVLGCEEAMGYSVGGIVRDKDGVSAAVAVADLAAQAKGQGRDLLDLLAILHRRHGPHARRKISTRLPQAEVWCRLGGILAAPPRQLGQEAVIRVHRLGEPDAGGRALDHADAVLLLLEGGDRVIVRGSGTEPLLKVYLDLSAPPGTPAEDLDRRANALTAAARALIGAATP